MVHCMRMQLREQGYFMNSPSFFSRQRMGLGEGGIPWKINDRAPEPADRSRNRKGEHLQEEARCERARFVFTAVH